MTNNENPFLSLFDPTPILSKKSDFSKTIENVFLFTWNGNLRNDKALIVIPSLTNDINDIDTASVALFERLLMTNIELKTNYRGEEKSENTHHVLESNPILYLQESYWRANQFQEFREIIIANFVTAFTEPSIYSNCKIAESFISGIVHFDDEEQIRDLLDKLIDSFGDDSFNLFLNPLFNELYRLVQEEYNSRFMYSVINYLTKNSKSAEAFIIFNQCEKKSILSYLLRESCCFSEEKYLNYFINPSMMTPSSLSMNENVIWTSLQDIHQNLYQIIKNICMASSKSTDLMLDWIGRILEANKGRGKLWSTINNTQTNNDSDSIMLNLGSVLLRLAHPFTEGIRNPKTAKIHKCYRKINQSSSKSLFLNLSDEATLILNHRQKENDNEIESESGTKSFNFITHIFYLTHKCLDLGFRVVQDEFLKLNRDLGQMQRFYRESLNQHTPEQIKQHMDSTMQKYLCYKAVLLEPISLEYLMQFTATSSSWLVHSALENSSGNELQALMFPIQIGNPSQLKYIPEFCVGNICEFLLLSKRFCPSVMEENNEYLPSFLDFIVMFMGAPKLMNNPHLRARMAECLDCLIPKDQDNSLSTSHYYRENLFIQYPHRMEIVPALLNVFVTIETTGQSVEFEQKFSYRRPMYDVITYLWKYKEYQNKFQELAKEAEIHFDAEEAPIFLRFVNLLINDAIFLLDEALSYMKQIQEKQLERESSWNSLPAPERAERESQYSSIERLARYHNIMGKETIKMLERLTSVIHSVFTHPTIMDRIAAMLNYFLKNLVGNERKRFKVKNLADYDFDPVEIVCNICKIYINFRECSSFLSSVSNDGRSYSEDLFYQAESVLVKISQFQLLNELKPLAESIKQVAYQNKIDETELFYDPPEEFLDPIMSVIMKDPVKLPTSGISIDRMTISRHLLSDQSDPFNRMPLTMDKVIPDTELKERITLWMNEKRQK